MTGRRILVLGGTGFVGGAVARRLAPTNQVTVFSRRPSDSDRELPRLQGDLTDWPTIDLSPYDTVVNAAGELRLESRMHAVHVEAPLGLLAGWQHQPGRRWVQISSVGVYGRVRSGTIVEASPFAPVGTYEVTKAEGDRRVREVAAEHGIGCTVLRPSNVFGLDMPNEHLRSLVRSIASGLFFVMARPEAVELNLVSAESVAEAVRLAVAAPSSGVADYIVNSGVRLADLIAVVGKVSGRERRFAVLPEWLVRPLVATLSRLVPVPLTSSAIDALTGSARYSSDRLRAALGFAEPVPATEELESFCDAVLSRARSR